MRVLSLLWGFSLGGVSKYAVGLHGLNDLSGGDLSLDTVCIYGESWGCDLRPLHEIGATFIPIRGRTDLSWIRRACGLIDARRPDLMLVHGFNGPVVARVCQKRVKYVFDFVCTYHGQYHPPRGSRKALARVFNDWQEHLYRRHAKAVAAVSEFSARYLLSKGIAEEKLSVIRNGIPAQVTQGDRDKLRAELGFTENDFVIGVASRLDPIKGLNCLIDALPSILRASKHVGVAILGDGPSKAELEAQCRRLCVSDAVRFAGYKADVPRWLCMFDLFALPSLVENHSIGLLEAMRAGLPIVTTGVGGNPESIEDGVSGLLVPPKDSGTLAKRIITCMRDRSMCDRLGAAARHRFEQEFTLERHLRRTAEWLLSCRNKN